MKNTIELWNKSEVYYKCAENKNAPTQKNPALNDLNHFIKKGMTVLDVGCGEGSILADIGKRKVIKGFGVDVSKIGINIAKKKMPKYTFKVVNSERIPFSDNYFDVVYSTYVFEHLNNPEIVLKEMKRVVKKNGLVIIICPNYGSPIYPSPITPKIKHLLRGIFRDFKYIFYSPKKLEWYKETPWLDKEWKPDYDTTALPYIYSLHKTSKPYIIASSVWNSESSNSFALKAIRFPFKILGLIGIYPFKWWGPICYFVWKKPDK